MDKELCLIYLFVFVVLIITVITFLLWLNIDDITFTLITSVTVLIIACPCALDIGKAYYWLADVDFAIDTGTDVAIESADVVLMRGFLSAVVDAIYISRMTTRNIKQNLFGAFIYNTLGIPVAAGILYLLFGILIQ